MTRLAEIGRALFAADDARRDQEADRRLDLQSRAILGRAIVARAENDAGWQLKLAGATWPDPAVWRAQAVLLDMLALDHPEHGAVLSQAAGELRNAATSVRQVLEDLAERRAA